ncbi:MAG: DNA repair exonuclease [Pseudomonadota bacterium]
MGFRFIHTGDLHLDSPMRGLATLGDDPRVKTAANASRDAFGRLVDRAIEERVDAFLIAGDLWDGDWNDVDAGLLVQREAKRLRDAGIGTFAILGNHDAASHVTDRIRDIDIHLFPTTAPTSVRCGGAVLHGMSYPQREMRHNIAAVYPPADPERINVGLLHTSLDGTRGHGRYAPCRLTDLAPKAYDYWALGHVHTREILAHELAKDGGTVAYCGVLQGRHIGETGPKGAWLVEIDAPGALPRLTSVDLPLVEWVRAEADLSEGVSPKAAIRAALETAAEAVADLLVVRLVLVGETARHHRLRGEIGALTKDAAMEAAALAGSRILLARLKIETTPIGEAPPLLPVGFNERLTKAATDEAVVEAAAAEIADILNAIDALGPTLEAEWPELAAARDTGDFSALLQEAARRVAEEIGSEDRS